MNDFDIAIESDPKAGADVVELAKRAVVLPPAARQELLAFADRLREDAS